MILLACPALAQLELPSASTPSVSAAPALPSPGLTLGAPARTGGTLPSGAAGSLAAPDPSGALGGPLGGFGTPFDAVRGPAGPARSLSLTPRIALEQIYNDNIRYTPTNRREDLITRVTPGLLATVDTQRLQGTFNYAPALDYYWQNTSENRVSQNFNGQGLATILPDLFFIDLRGQAATQSLSGGFGPESQGSTGRDNTVQTYSFSFSPYLVQRFGGLASARLGYVLNYVNQNRQDRNAPLPDDQLQSSFTPSEYTSHQAYLVGRTGENFGRLALQGTLSGTTFEGNGLYEGAYRNLALVESLYGINRTIAALVELGYETQHFNTVPETNVDDVVWALGTRLTPDPDTTITAKYGRRDGFNSFFLQARVGLGVRTTLFADYSERLTSSALSAGDLLSTTTVDRLGNTVDAATGQPVLPSFASSNLGVQSGLQRQKVGSVSVSQAWARDTFRLTATRTDRTPVADAPGATQRGFAQESTTFSLNWTHDLAEDTVLTAFGQYGITSSGRSSGDSDTYGAGVSLTQRLSTNLNGVLSYRLNIRDGGTTTGGQTQGDDRAVQNIITAGLRQSF